MCTLSVLSHLRYELFTILISSKALSSQSTLAELSQAAHAFRVVVDSGVSQLHTAIIKPRIKPLVDAFNNVNHDITEDEYALYETTDPFVENFLFNVQSLLGLFEVCCSLPVELVEF